MSAEPLTPEELEWLRRKATTAHETEADTEWADSPLFGADEVLALFAAIDSLSQELKAAREEREKLLGRHDYDGESWPYSKCKLCGADGMDWRHVHISRVAAAALDKENG